MTKLFRKRKLALLYDSITTNAVGAFLEIFSLWYEMKIPLKRDKTAKKWANLG
jgi:hypothetical protein